MITVEVGSRSFSADYADCPTLLVGDNGKTARWLPIKICVDDIVGFTSALADCNSAVVSRNDKSWLLEGVKVLNRTVEGVSLTYKHARLIND